MRHWNQTHFWEKTKNLDRRDFLKKTVGVCAMIACSREDNGNAAPVGQRGRLPAIGQETKVFLAGVSRGVSEEGMKSAVRAVAETTTDFSWLSKGDAVFIKPALNSGNPYPATTNPTAIAAMVELLKEKGAGRVIVGDMSGIEHVKLSETELRGSSRRLMERSGMARAVQTAGAEVHFFEEAGWKAFFEDAPVAGTHWKGGIMMPNILKDIDHIILMPRCGRHVLAGSTLGLKAAVGYWRTDTRLEYHRDASTFQEKTAEGNTVETLRKKQRLVLSSADKVLTTFGTDNGHVFQPETGLVIASESVVAHDMVSLAWLLETRRSVPSRVKAGFKDPYNYQLVVSIANHWVVGKLGGWGPVFTAAKLARNDINRIWDDRVLNRAFQVFGGMPRVILEAANGALPADLKKRLGGMTTLGA
jgi:uncharacterized protein (DUF362 family)